MLAALALLSAGDALAQAPEQGSDYLAEAERQFAIRPDCRQTGEAEEIVVCGRRDQDERYRLPIRPDRFDPKGPVDSVSRERHRLVQEGDSGIGSCSTDGPGGWTGCFHRNTKRRCEQETCGFAF